MRSFNVTGECNPRFHYMVDINQNLHEIKLMVDKGNYFTINRARQYGKTTTLSALDRYLKDTYVVNHLDFQLLSYKEFSEEALFVSAFVKALLWEVDGKDFVPSEIKERLMGFTDSSNPITSLSEMFRCLSEWCAQSAKPIVLMIAIEEAEMFGFIKEVKGSVSISNRIFEIVLYNLFLTEPEVQISDIYKAALGDKNQFIENGRLNMRLVLEKFIQQFTMLYGEHTRKFYEEEGRKYFLMFLRPIINGTGNYYIEPQTRTATRSDVIVDYRGEQFVIELKIWGGPAYHTKGEQQLAEYLAFHNLKTGYMLTFNFNQKKEIGIKEVAYGDKILIEAVV